MGMERLLSDDNVGHQVVGGVQKLFQTGGDLQGWVGDKRARLQELSGYSRIRLSHPNLLRNSLERVKPLIDLAGLRSNIDLLDLLAEIDGIKLMTAVLGVNDVGRPITIDLNAPDMHNVLVAGEDGSGKSALIRSMLISLVLNNDQRHLQLAMVEYNSSRKRWGANGNGYKLLSYLPHTLASTAAGYDDIVDLIGFLTEEVERRRNDSVERPLIILVLDNFDRLMAEAGKVLRRQIIHLIQEGRYAGIRVILGLRGIDDFEFLPLLRMNFPVKLVGRVRNRGQLRQLASPAKHQIKILEGMQPRSRSGDFVAMAHAHAVPFRAAYIDDYDTYTVVTCLHHRKSPKIVARPRAIGQNARSPGENSLVNSIDQGGFNDPSFPERVDWEDGRGESLEIAPAPYEDFYE